MLFVAAQLRGGLGSPDATCLVTARRYAQGMAGFAERMGLKAPRTVLQTQSLDEETRTGLWNVVVGLQTVFRQKERFNNDDTQTDLLDRIWAWHFQKPLDERPNDSQMWSLVKAEVQKAEWAEVLDLLESLVKHLDRVKSDRMGGIVPAISGAFNDRFETFLVGYRFIDGQITPVDSNTEAEAIARAVDDASVVAGARHHLERAVDLLADRAAPDYPNSIKESISAVESVVKKVTGEHTLGAGLKKLEGAGLTIHPALKGAWSQMYGWTSDEAGIRHGGIDAAEVDQALAKYVLVTCSAFVSYLTEEGRKAGLI